jgi:hypothetical protein
MVIEKTSEAFNLGGLLNDGIVGAPYLAFLYSTSDKVNQVPDDDNEQSNEPKDKQYRANWHQHAVLYHSALGYCGQTIPNSGDDEANYNQYNAGD